MERIIQDFIRMTLYGALTTKDHKGPPTLVDALEFETFVSGSATPTIEFAPLGQATRVANATITGLASRKDVHKLTIGLAIDTAGFGFLDPARVSLFGLPPTAALTARGSTALIASPSLFGPQVFAKPRTSSEFAAVAAVNQVLTTKLAQQQRILITAP
jgi:hypothetical protein